MNTTYTNNAISVDGEPIEKIIRERNFVGNLMVSLGADPAQQWLFDAMLVAWCDHGQAPPSTQAAIYAASCGVPLTQALVAAFSCMGVHHCPIVKAGEYLQKTAKAMERPPLDAAATVAATLAAGERIPGFGHPLHTVDPRIVALLGIARKTGAPGKHWHALLAIESALTARGKTVNANLAGVCAALGLDIGLPCGILDLIPILGRSVGLAAHVARQKEEPPLKLG